MSDETKFLLNEKQIPEAWYNIQADLPAAAPAGHPPGHAASRSAPTTWHLSFRWRSSARR